MIVITFFVYNNGIYIDKILKITIAFSSSLNPIKKKESNGLLGATLQVGY